MRTKRTIPLLSSKYYYMKDRYKFEKKINHKLIVKTKIFKLNYGYINDIDLERTWYYIDKYRYYVLYQNGSLSSLFVDVTKLLGNDNTNDYIMKKKIKHQKQKKQQKQKRKNKVEPIYEDE